MNSKWLVVVVAMGVGISSSRGARAQATEGDGAATTDSATPAEPPHTLQENFGFGAQLGFYNPSGLTVRAGVRAISLDVTAGFVPLLLDYGSTQNPSLKLLAPFEVTPQVLIDVVNFKNDIRGGLRFGYRYNTALGYGLTVGGQIGKRVTKKLLLEGLWGISYYPHASDNLRGDQMPADTHFNLPPELGYGLSVGLLYYP
ncbi:MAG: hypothetical protein ABI548_10695 [Polyangiaceae bacterium]